MQHFVYVEDLTLIIFPRSGLKMRICLFSQKSYHQKLHSNLATCINACLKLLVVVLLAFWNNAAKVPVDQIIHSD